MGEIVKLLLAITVVLIVNCIVGIISISSYMVYRLSKDERLIQKLNETSEYGVSELNSEMNYYLNGTRDTSENKEKLKKIETWIWFAIFWPSGIEKLKDFFDNY